MYRYYLAQICSPKYYLSHIVLQRRSRTQPNILPLFKNTHSRTNTTQINSHKQSNRHKQIHTHILGFLLRLHIYL